MPRIYIGTNDPLDFCHGCMPPWSLAVKKYRHGVGPDNRGDCFGYEEDHPPYAGENYLCETCGKRLTEEDD